MAHRLVELVDKHDIPLAVTSLGTALRQRLLFRLTVTCVLLDSNLLILHKKAQCPFKNQEKWDLCTDAVLAGESREDAAIRGCQEQFGFAGIIPVVKITQHLVEPYHTIISLLHTQLPKNYFVNPQAAQESFLVVDQDELHGLISDLPDLFSFSVHWALSMQLLFPTK